MHLNTDPPGAETPQKPCLRDFAELVNTHLPCAVVRLVPLDELERRTAEIAAEKPRFKEEAPLVLAMERRRRARHQGLFLETQPLPRRMLASEAYFHA